MRGEAVGRSKAGITGNQRYPDNSELGDFLLRECKRRRLSLRSLSINSGLSPSTVPGIIKRKYQPSLFSLNRLADYLGVKREYLWQLAGLLQDMDYDTETTFGDPRLRFQLARADKLPEVGRNLVIGIVDVVITFLNRKHIIDLLRHYPDMGHRKIADVVGCSRQRVHQLAQRAGLTRNTKARNYRSDVTMDRVLELYHQGLLVRDIAKALKGRRN